MSLTVSKLKKIILEVLRENEVEPLTMTPEYQKVMDEMDKLLRSTVGEEKYKKIKDWEKTEPEQAAELARAFVGDKYPQRLLGSDIVDKTIGKKGWLRSGDVNTEMEEEEVFFGIVKRKVEFTQKRKYNPRTNKISNSILKKGGDDQTFPLELKLHGFHFGKGEVFGKDSAWKCNIKIAIGVYADGDMSYEPVASTSITGPSGFPQDEKQITTNMGKQISDAINELFDSGEIDKGLKYWLNRYNIK